MYDDNNNNNNNKRGYKLKTIVGKECEVEKNVQQRGCAKGKI
jgi:hypothetical protein